MGYLTSLGIRESGLPLVQQLQWHFASNIYPPLRNPGWITAAIQALDAVNNNEPDTIITLPDGVTFNGETKIPAEHFVVNLALEAWLIDDES